MIKMIQSLKTTWAVGLLSLLTVLLTTNAAEAQLRPNLGTASTYAVFTGAGSIISTGTSVLTGDIGWNTGGPLTGFPPSTYTGTYNHGNGATAQALIDLGAAQTADGLVACGTVIGVGIADGQSFDPGKYCSGGQSTTTGTITFNAHGNGNAIFIVDIGGALSANAGTHIVLANNARAANIYWFVNGAVAIADGSSFTGTIIAKGAIHFYGTSSLNGRALASPAGAISLVSSHMSIPTDSGTANNLTVVKPAVRDSIRGGTVNDTIRWTGTGIARVKTLQYSLDSGVTWTTISTITNDSLMYVWHVPDTTSTKALVRVTDTSNLRGVSGVFTITSSKIIVTHPALVGTPPLPEMIAGGTQNYQITWTGVGLTPKKIFKYSLDSGLTWRTIDSISANVFTHSWNLPDTVSGRAMVSITDSNGITGKSAMFTIKSSKIIVIHPALAEAIAGGTQNYQITWSGLGLTSHKTYEYSLDSGVTWKTIDTSSTELLTHSWNVPDTSSTKAFVRITDKNGITGKSGLFTIKSSKITVTHPALAEAIKGGMMNYQITWTGVGLASQKTFDYSLDNGVTWKTIGTITADVFTYSWNVPDTVSAKSVVRITDKNGITGKSSVFTIKASKITVTHPALADGIVGGTLGYQIMWTGTATSTTKTFDLSLDGGLTWKTFGTSTADALTYSWNVPDTVSTLAIIRITDNTGLTGKSGAFAILSSKTPVIVLTHPTAGETLVGGMADSITWTGAMIATQKTFDYSLDAGVTWKTIGILNADVSTYPWSVPDTTISNRALVRITDKNGLVGTSGLFTITSSKPNGSIVILHPFAGEVIPGDTLNFLIDFTAVNVTPHKAVEYSLDGGGTWSLIGILNSDALSITWANVPNIGTTQALVRITDGNGVVGVSSLFTIKFIAGVGSINSLTLSGLDVTKNIGNNKTLGITWTFTPDIGTSVEVEYSLDYTANWTHIATVPVTDAPSTSWTTTMTGFYNPVFVRVTSTKGMTVTSAPFSIGSNLSVYSAASQNGYSISNYPNPVSGQTTIEFTLPVDGDVALVVNDAVGHEMMTFNSRNMSAGTHTVNFNAAGLASGVYTYRLIAGQTVLIRKMNVVR